MNIEKKNIIPSYKMGGEEGKTRGRKREDEQLYMTLNIEK